MLTLLRATANTDWKGRPNVYVEIISRANNRADLIAAMNADVDRIKATDIQDDITQEAADAADEERPPMPHSGDWTIKGERWEMDRDSPDDLRQLAGQYSDGGNWSITFHILPI